MATAGDDPWPTTGSHGHYFLKKNFHKPSYCHHCSDLVWGLLGQGYVCEGILKLFFFHRIFIASMFFASFRLLILK